MAAKLPMKKKPALQAEAGSDEGSSGSDSSDVDSQLEVQVDFEARQIEEGDFHGIRKLLQQMFLKANVDLSGLTNLILTQNTIGSTVKVSEQCEEDIASDKEEGEEGEVYGITTVINLTHHSQSHDCVRQVVAFLLSQCSTYCVSQHPQLSQLLQDNGKHVGLLVNERFLNIPPDIAPPLLRSLLEEVKQVTRKGQPFNFHYYVVITRSHVVSLTKPEAGKKRKKKEKRDEATAPTDRAKYEEPQMFDHFENEVLQKESLLTFSYPVSEESDSVLGGKWSFDDEAMQPCRTVMVISAGKLEKGVTELERTFSN